MEHRVEVAVPVVLLQPGLARCDAPSVVGDTDYFFFPLRQAAKTGVADPVTPEPRGAGRDVSCSPPGSLVRGSGAHPGVPDLGTPGPRGSQTTDSSSPGLCRALAPGS